MLLITFSLLIGMTFLLLAKLSLWRYNCSQLMPGQKLNFLNIFGDLIEVINYLNSDAEHPFQLKILNALVNHCKTFRRQQLFCLWGFYTPLVFLIKSGAVKEVLNANGLKEKSWIYEWGKLGFGNGLPCSQHAIWKPRRKMINRCFHPDVLRGFFPIFNDKAQKLVNFFQENGKEFIAINDTIQLCSVDVVCETVFNVKTDTLGKQKSQYAEAVRRAGELFMNRICQFWLWPEFIFWNTPSGRDMKSHLKVLKDFTRKVMHEKKEQYFTPGCKIYEGKRQALLDLLLDLHCDTNQLSEEDLLDEVNSFALAGSDTTASTVTWALYMIGLFPEIQTKIHQELDRVFEKDINKEATEDDLNQLFYLDCVLKETLRLYPPLPLFGRKVEEDTIICGYTIPKGASCLIFLYSLHRDEDVFPDPEKFYPERFLPENSRNIPEYAYIPFSGGPRNCIGYRYAMMEVKILVSAVLRNFVIEPLDVKNKILPKLQITLQPSKPIYMRFLPRKL